MDTFSGHIYLPQPPDVVQVALRVLQLYITPGMERCECTNEEDSMIANAAECVRDYIAQVGRFAPVPPPQQVAISWPPPMPISALQQICMNSQQNSSAME
jgi:hypothetical protein